MRLLAWLIAPRLLYVSKIFMTSLPDFSQVATDFQVNRVRIGVDYGPRLIGIAISGPFGSVRPYQTVSNTGNLTALSFDILSLATREGASEIVVGIPVDRRRDIFDEVRNFNGRLCLNFSSVLASVAKEHGSSRLQVKVMDEKYTTKEAHLRLQQQKLRGICIVVSSG
jgi:RNase H-fold protein (predicted Holliday junction resolvase)